MQWRAQIRQGPVSRVLCRRALALLPVLGGRSTRGKGYCNFTKAPGLEITVVEKWKGGPGGKREDEHLF